MKKSIVGIACVLACTGNTPEEAGTRGARAFPGDTATSQATGSGQAASDLNTRKASEKVTVLFFGTSLTAGYGLDPSIAFPNLVAARAGEAGLPIVAVNAGLSGETSAGAVRRIEWVLQQPADIIVIETGGNDALRALDADSLESNLRTIVDRVRAAAPRARILLAVMEAPPNLGAAYTRRFREAYANVARAENLTLVPFLLEGVAGHAELNQADGVHPNERGEVIVAENVWQVLKPVVVSVREDRLRNKD